MKKKTKRVLENKCSRDGWEKEEEQMVACLIRNQMESNAGPPGSAIRFDPSSPASLFLTT